MLKIFNYKTIDEDNFTDDYIKCDIIDLVNNNKNNKNVAFISAANSLLFMDGGSDLGYMKSINNIENKVKHAAKSLNYISNCGRNYIPIGASQLIIPEESYK